LKDEDGDDATGITVTVDPLLLVNMSVWQDIESLFDFVYKSAHAGVMAQRRDFFVPFPKERAYQVLWWMPAGQTPTLHDGLAKLWHLDRFGPTPLAFTLKQRFPAPNQGAEA
jgi:hypothetical protein